MVGHRDSKPGESKGLFGLLDYLVDWFCPRSKDVDLSLSLCLHFLSSRDAEVVDSLYLLISCKRVGGWVVIRPASWSFWKCLGYSLLRGWCWLKGSIVVSFARWVHTPRGIALRQAVAWVLSLLRYLSCWLGLRCTRNWRSPVSFQNSAVP
jgi:hypothetical protein